MIPMTIWARNMFPRFAVRRVTWRMNPFLPFLPVRSRSPLVHSQSTRRRAIPAIGSWSLRTGTLVVPLRGEVAGTLSGGEQRMLGLGMALMRQPRLLLLDEPSLGLAPLLVERIMDTVREIVRRESLTVLLVEQNVRHALAIAQRVYVMRTGRLILEETGAAMAARGQWWDLF